MSGLYIYSLLLPDLKGVLELNPGISFLISFVGVDYLYYWHHRLLHHKFLFPVHAVHHTVTQMDMLGSSRNTLWSSFLLPYLWVNGFMLYIINDFRSYSLGIFLTSLLDLWRHSSLNLPQQSIVYQVLNYCLILPKDHAYNYSRNKPDNFAANWKLWDRLHGTYVDSHSQNQSLGITLNMSLMKKLFYPFSEH